MQEGTHVRHHETQLVSLPLPTAASEPHREILVTLCSPSPVERVPSRPQLVLGLLSQLIVLRWNAVREGFVQDMHHSAAIYYMQTNDMTLRTMLCRHTRGCACFGLPVPIRNVVSSVFAVPLVPPSRALINASAPRSPMLFPVEAGVCSRDSRAVSTPQNLRVWVKPCKHTPCCTTGLH